MFLEPAQHPELAVARRIHPSEMPAIRSGVRNPRATVRIAADGLEIEVELTDDDLADIGGFVAPIPTIFA